MEPSDDVAPLEELHPNTEEEPQPPAQERDSLEGRKQFLMLLVLVLPLLLYLLLWSNSKCNETCVEVGYINTTCIFNAFHAIQYLISVNPFVKLFFFSFTTVFPWLSWLLFIIDPDAVLSGRGIICVIFHFYDILLIPATLYLGWVFVLRRHHAQYGLQPGSSSSWW